MFLKKTFLSLFIPLLAQARDCHKNPIKIAVIDTGFGYKGLGQGANLCKTGHRDFSLDQKYTNNFGTKTPVPVDTNSHGTNIVGIIEQYGNLNRDEYCIVIIKYFSAPDPENPLTKADADIIASARSFEYLKKLKPDIVNYSSDGQGHFDRERNAVVAYLNHKGIIVAAAGNENVDTTKSLYPYCPASYDKRIIVVGAIGRDGRKSRTSNYGSRVDAWELGVDVEGYGIHMSGTSQATAIHTSKLAGQMQLQCVK